MIIGDWTERGACRDLAQQVGPDVAVDMFYPKPGSLSLHSAYCRRCEVRCDCLLWGLLSEDYGAWGGTTRADRKMLRRAVADGSVTLVDILRARQCGDVADRVEMNGTNI